MAIITGVKFRTPSKVYYFDPGELQPKYNDHVIVETARGLEYGRVVLPLRDVPEDEIKQPLKEVIRIATPEDDAHEKSNRRREEDAYVICQKKIREHGLEMKLVAAEYTFDNSKLTFYFTADGRVDFRELVKDLASIFRTRIELRQIGVRDETKIIGGIGTCGRTLCCHAYLHEFAPVSIKMAKEQNLSLNPTKISGTCGRLMCCLKNEAETYEYLNRGLPRKGDGATTPDGLSAEVQSVNILRQTVRVIVNLENDEKEMREYPVSEITFVSKKGRKKSADEAQASYRQAVSREDIEEGAAAFLAGVEEEEFFENPEDVLVLEELILEEEEEEKGRRKEKERRSRRKRHQKQENASGDAAEKPASDAKGNADSAEARENTAGRKRANADAAENGENFANRKRANADAAENDENAANRKRASEDFPEGAEKPARDEDGAPRKNRRHKNRRKPNNASGTDGNEQVRADAPKSGAPDNSKTETAENPFKHHRRKRNHNRKNRTGEQPSGGSPEGAK